MRLIIEHPREWLASLADYPARLRAQVKSCRSGYCLQCLSLTLANGCNPTTSSAQDFQHASTKIPRVVCLSHPCTFRHSSVFCLATQKALVRPHKGLARPRREVVHQQQQQRNEQQKCYFMHKLEQLDCMTVAKLFNLSGHLQEVT